MKTPRGKEIINSLSFKFVISMIIVAIIPLMLYLILNGIIINNTMSDIEEKTTAQRANQAKVNLYDKASNILMLAKEYGIWNETYNNIANGDKQWVDKTIIDWVPRNYGIDLIIILDKTGKPMRYYGTTEDDIVNVTNNKVITNILKGEYNGENKSYPSGLISSNGGLYLIGITPIIKEDYKKSTGVLIFGKKIDSKFISNVKSEFGYDMIIELDNSLENSYLYYDKDNINKIKDFKTCKNKGNISFMGKEHTRYVQGIDIFDILDSKVGVMYILESRKIFIDTHRIILDNGFKAFSFSVLIIIIISAIFRKAIVSPIQDFQRQISRFGENKKLSAVNVKGSTEITKLAETFNCMIEDLQENRKENETLKKISITDEQTGLYNHGYFYKYSEKVIIKEKKPTVMLFCDIDYFKRINDTFGHITGDGVLREIANIIKEQCDEKGISFRYGGEEFVVLLHKVSMKEAYVIAEKLRLNIGSNEELKKCTGGIPVTISIGLASFKIDTLSIENFVQQADKAVYLAKESGRNQCRIYNKSL